MNKSSSPYYKRHAQPELKTSYCLFIDILGFSDEIKKERTLTTQNILLRKFHTIYTNATKDLRFDTDFHKEFYSSKYPFPWAIKLFTDNIILGCPLSRLPHVDDESLFGQIIIEILFFQLELAINEYFTRGGWAIGPLYIDDNIVYGNAVIEAHELEKEAIYPCIILSKQMGEIVQKHLKYYGRAEMSPHYRMLLKDQAGHTFINYLYGLVFDDRDPSFSDLLIHKSIVCERLILYKDNNNISSKYQWLADYHNYFCDSFIEKCPKKYYIIRLKKYCFSRIG